MINDMFDILMLYWRWIGRGRVGQWGHRDYRDWQLGKHARAGRVGQSRYANVKIMRTRHHHNRRPDWIPVTKGLTRSIIGIFYQNRCTGAQNIYINLNQITAPLISRLISVHSESFNFQFMEPNYSLITPVLIPVTVTVRFVALFVLMSRRGGGGDVTSWRCGRSSR